jgi:hypothetical protein
MKLETKFGNRIDSDSGYDNLKLAQDLVTIAEKHYTKQLLIPRVVKSLCEHHWVNAKNIGVKSGQICVKCHSVKA